MLIAALVIAPVPDNTIAAVDREHIIGIYAGIAPASPGVTTDHIHIVSTGTVEPNHAADLGNNVLVAGQVEVQGGGYFGGAANYSKFETDGTLKFNGAATVWKDINIGAATLSGPPGLQPGIVNFVDNLGADTGIATYGLAVGEGFSGQFEMQHDYKEDSDISFHVHYQGIAAPSGTDKIQFQLKYSFGNDGVTLAPVTTIVIEVNIDTQYEFNRVTFATISGTNVDIEDQFLFTLQRIAASTDEYSGETLIATVGIHYEIDTIGTRQMLTK